MEISDRLKKIKPSATLAISSKAKEMKKQGIDVLSFSAGEPDFDTPPNIADAGIRAIESGFTRYTDASGIPELKQAVCNKVKKDTGFDVTPQNVIVSCGAKHSLFNLFTAYLNPGDEVILPAPYWLTYPAQIELVGAKTVYLPTSEKNGFVPTKEEIERVITDKTRAIIVNSPGNPTGSVWSRKSLEVIAEIALQKNLLIISDECYEKLVYDGNEHVPISSLSQEVFNQTITINAVSKTYAMTGWRIGYTVGDLAIIKAMSVLQSQVTSNPASISQKAALEALSGDQSEVQRRNKAFNERRKEMVRLLNGLPGVHCIEPYGAFYCFPNVSSVFGKSYKGKSISNSVDFCEVMLSQAQVALVPGAPFGADDHVRLSYACSLDDIREGISRMNKILSSL